MPPLRPAVTCCLCGIANETVAHCGICNHNFCRKCRYNLWGREGRVRAAVKQLLTKVPPMHCKCKENR